MEEQDGAAPVFGHLEARSKREVDVERREDAQGHAVAVRHDGEGVVDAAAGIGYGQLGAEVLGGALRLVELFDVGPDPRGGSIGCQDGLVHGHGSSSFRGDGAARRGWRGWGGAAARRVGSSEHRSTSFARGAFRSEADTSLRRIVARNAPASLRLRPRLPGRIRTGGRVRARATAGEGAVARTARNLYVSSGDEVLARRGGRFAARFAMMAKNDDSPRPIEGRRLHETRSVLCTDSKRRRVSIPPIS